MSTRSGGDPLDKILENLPKKEMEINKKITQGKDVTDEEDGALFEYLRRIAYEATKK